MLHIKKVKDSTIINLALLLMFLPLINSNLSLLIKKILDNQSSITTIITFSVMIALGFYSYLLVIIKNIKYFIFFLLVVILLIISMLLNNNLHFVFLEFNNFDPRNSISILFLYCIPIFNYVALIKNPKIFYQKLFFFGMINLILGLIAYIFVQVTLKSTIEYMTFSYSILTSTIIVFSYGLYSKNHLILMFSLVGVTTIFISGSRGAFLSLIAYIAIKIYLSNELKLTFKIYLISISIFLIFIISFYFNIMINLLIEWARNLGLGTRTLELLIANEFSISIGREQILRSVIKSIVDSPIYGNGIFSDRLIIANTTNFGNVYTHNIFIEILSNFGLFFGGIFILFILYNIVHFVFFEKDFYKKEVFLVLLPFGFFQLIFSNSYLTNSIFFALLALMIKRIRVRKSVIL